MKYLAIFTSLMSWLAMGSDYFPKNYESSKKRFLKNIDDYTRSHSEVLRKKFYVPSNWDKDLTIDYVHFAALKEQKNLIVMVSGVHGPEAYTGAALINLFFEKYLSKVNRDNTGVILVHAMNPFGFKFHRRYSENNVNLNRNFDTDESLFNIDNSGYERFSSLLAPAKRLSLSTIKSWRTSLKLLSEIVSGRASVDQLTEAVGRGQYKFKSGIEFGGYSFEPQVKHFQNSFKKMFHGYKNIVVFDIHTGLGKQNTLHMMTGRLFDESNRAFLKELFVESPGIEITDENDDGFYRVYGDMVDFTQKVAKESKGYERFLGLTLEFGTIGNGLIYKLKSVNRMINENQGFHHGYFSKRQERKVKKRFLKMFYPDNKKWKTQVIEKASVVFDQLIMNLK